MTRHDLDTTRPWLRDGTTHVLAVVDKLTDDDLRAPSALPGWTRAHVVGHLARNAEALVRLATWARTGVETPMYANGEQRAAEIEQSAGSPANVLRAQVVDTASALEAALDDLTADQWQAPVRSALGRPIPAAEVPWMRIREVWLHAVDLDAGATVDDLPSGVVDLLLDDVTAALSTKQDCPAVDLVPTDRNRTWRLDTIPPAVTVQDRAADLAGWLTGRLSYPDRVGLPRWL